MKKAIVSAAVATLVMAAGANAAKLDKNGQRDFNGLDTDGNSTLSQAEFLEGISYDAQERMAKIFNNRDKDGDKQLTRDEYYMKKAQK